MFSLSVSQANTVGMCERHLGHVGTGTDEGVFDRERMVSGSFSGPGHCTEPECFEKGLGNQRAF